MTIKFTHKHLALVVALTTFFPLGGLSGLLAQTTVPDAMNFQAIARDASNNIVANTSIEVQMTVHNTSSTGPILSQLRFIRNTDAFGQFSLTMSVDSASGIGTAQTVAFNQIDWSTGDKYIQIEYKPSIASPYIDLGAIRANSTFYAFHARTAENITLSATNGQVLKYNSTSGKWVAGTDNNTTYTAGSGININGSNVVSATDASATNEKQNLSYNSTTGALTIDNGGNNNGNNVILPIKEYAMFEERYSFSASGGSVGYYGMGVGNALSTNTWTGSTGNNLITGYVPLTEQTPSNSSNISYAAGTGIITLAPGKYILRGYTGNYTQANASATIGLRSRIINANTSLELATGTLSSNAASSVAAQIETLVSNIDEIITISGNNAQIKFQRYINSEGGTTYSYGIYTFGTIVQDIILSKLYIEKLQ